MIDDEEINAIKRKSQQADNIMLSHPDGHDEGSQLIDDDLDMSKTPLKSRNIFKRGLVGDADSDDDGKMHYATD